ncbi:MAG: hypothetical protein INR64_16800, partial [Caulobacteraceae bacterium]|nr:hypothetical protein [Caulobacter sp.]
MPTLSDTRFGLPLSLAEALRQDPSPEAAELATLLEAEPPRLRRAACACRAAGARIAVGITGLAAGLSLAGHALAAGPSMVGRWVLAPASSQFSEAVTGAAPDKVVVTVTRDDAARFAYRVDETRAGAPV